MYCFQCEQTQRGIACLDRGVCGKDDITAVLQDLLLHVAKGISAYCHRAALLGARDVTIDRFIADILFTTVTNVNFDPDRLDALLTEAIAVRDRAHALHSQACAGSDLAPKAGPANCALPPDRAGRLAVGRAVAIDHRADRLGADVVGLQELLTYGVKGAAAYACHARELGHEDSTLYAFFHEALATLAEEPVDTDQLMTLTLRCGEAALATLALLDSAHTASFGHPRPTPVTMGGRQGKAILVSGHDLEDLRCLLEQTAGTGIRVYTHGEMLPAHGYPGLNRHAHLAGHYGGAWMLQRREFAAFPGPILMTTNCLQEPTPAYRDRLFTSGVVAWPGIRHIANRDFHPLIEAAQAAPGFAEDQPARTHVTGFGHDAVLERAGAITGALESGALGRLVLIGGCDGAEAGRNYYTTLAETMPEDWLVLTMGCGKFRVIGSDLGTIGGDPDGLPRLIDMGQCNDSYSAVKVALALADRLGVGVNQLPLSLVVSWYEQKAVAVLLALLHLGLRDIRLGPRLPAFLTPTLLEVLVKRFNILPIGTVAGDIAAMRAA